MSRVGAHGLLVLVALTALGCSRSVSGWSSAMAGHAAVSDAQSLPHRPDRDPAPASGVPVAAAPDEPPDWRVGPMVGAGPTDVPTGMRGEASLLPFEFDQSPIEAWRYDACVKDKVCPSRYAGQPATDLPIAPAVGMRWEDAERFCAARGMKAQTPLTAWAIANSGVAPLGPERLAPHIDPKLVVSAGFRCTRELHEE